MRNIGKNNLWIFRKILAKKCAEIQKMDRTYRHDFTKAEPSLKLTIEISEMEFSVAVLEHENEILVKKLERANKKLAAFEHAAKPKPTFEEQLQIDADEDIDFEDDDPPYDPCPRCGIALCGGECPNCEFPGAVQRKP
jgi:hypothetical protein